MIKKFVGNRKSITANSSDGRIWQGQLFQSGRVTKFSEATWKEVEELARKHGMRPADPTP